MRLPGEGICPGGPVTFSPATYVTYHVTVNVMYHVMQDRGRLPADQVT